MASLSYITRTLFQKNIFKNVDSIYIFKYLNVIFTLLVTLHHFSKDFSKSDHWVVSEGQCFQNVSFISTPRFPL